MTSRRKFLRQAMLAAGATAAATLLPRTLLDASAYHPSPLPVDIDTAALASQGLLIGCAVHSEALGRDTAYTQLVAKQANILVAENCMKWASLHPSPDRYTFSSADALVRFAEANRMQMRGHNLVWHESLPPWVEKQTSAANARQVLGEHIRTVAGRYAGRMHSWDVVNEAIEINDGRPDGLRKSLWLQLLGEDYIPLAFADARAADPQALLTYNDFGIEYDTQNDSIKRQMVMELLHRLKSSGTPIDAVGIQSHLRAGTGEKVGPGLRDFIREAHRMGLQVFVTELDVDDTRLPTDVRRRDSIVADVYRQYLDLVLAEGVSVVLTWGITDRYTYIDKLKPRFDGQHQRPLPFDDSLQPTAAFFAMRSAVQPVLRAKAAEAIPKQVTSTAEARPRLDASSPKQPAAPSTGEWANDPYAPFSVPQKPPK